MKSVSNRCLYTVTLFISANGQINQLDSTLQLPKFSASLCTDAEKLKEIKGLKT